MEPDRGLVAISGMTTVPEVHPPPTEFDRYELQVREEYRFLPDSEWRTGRARVLRRFLDQPRIFLTPELAAFEAPARANLARSIAQLEAAIR